MAHKTLVGGTAYETKGGKCLVGGTGYAIKKGRTLVDGTGRDVVFSKYDPVFANNTWDAIIEACQAREVPDTWAIGDTKTMNIYGVEQQVMIIGKNHDDYADGSGKAPITFQLEDCLGTTFAMNSSDTNVGGWRDCALRSTLASNIIGTLPAEAKQAVKAVKKLSSEGNKSSTIVTTEDKLFLLSEIEACGTTQATFAGEGSQYAYYQAGNSKIKKVKGAASDWWLRSPQKTLAVRFGMIAAGGTFYTGTASTKKGIAFAFCF